jgi:hypothetical protein
MMEVLDRLFGRKSAPKQPAAGRSAPYGAFARNDPGPLTDEQAIARYRYMISTAPPETIEQAHAEAFAKLTPEQRQVVLRELSTTLPEAERAAIRPGSDDPQSLARMATRAELRQPGTVERALGGVGGPGLGLGTTLFASLAAGFVGSMVAQSFMDSFADPGLLDAGADGSAAADETGGDVGGDVGGDWFGDGGGGDIGGEF